MQIFSDMVYISYINDVWKPFRKDTWRFSFVLPHRDDFRELSNNCEKTAFLLRVLSIYSMTCGALGHPGGSFSDAELLSVLYEYVLRHKADEPNWKMRDVFYLSKCHACPSTYAILALFGYFDISELKNYGTWGAMLESHPDRLKTPGIEISGGSLGQIPGVAVGRALAIKQKGPDHANRMVYSLVGDGECDEGSVWEAFMSASAYCLDNLVFVIDYNKVQAKGFVNDDMKIEPLGDKLKAFGMDVREIRNGHDVTEIINVFNDILVNRRGKPFAVILNTIKGYPVERCEYNPNWHTSAPRSKEMAREWLEELWIKDGQRMGIPHEFIESIVSDIEISKPLHGEVDKFEDRQA